MILPPATLGMLGGGQLGRFFVSAAHEMGYKVWVLDPDPHSPAGLVADRHLIAAYDDYVALDSLGSACAAVTTEFENVPADTLDYLSKFIPVHPAASAVAVCQNRIAEKTFLADNGLPLGPFAIIRGEDDIRAADAGLFPAVLKVARFGYDGKGQARVADHDQALAAFQHFKAEPCVLEKMLTLDFEVSVVLARDEAGTVRGHDRNCFLILRHFFTPFARHGQLRSGRSHHPRPGECAGPAPRQPRPTPTGVAVCAGGQPELWGHRGPHGPVRHANGAAAAPADGQCPVGVRCLSAA